MKGKKSPHRSDRDIFFLFSSFGFSRQERCQCLSVLLALFLETGFLDVALVVLECLVDLAPRHAPLSAPGLVCFLNSYFSFLRQSLIYPRLASVAEDERELLILLLLLPSCTVPTFSSRVGIVHVVSCSQLLGFFFKNLSFPHFPIN